MVIVLILVLMEDTLRAQQSSWATTEYEVLILVLMEDTLRGSSEIWEELKNKS